MTMDDGNEQLYSLIIIPPTIRLIATLMHEQPDNFQEPFEMSPERYAQNHLSSIISQFSSLFMLAYRIASHHDKDNQELKQTLILSLEAKLAKSILRQDNQTPEMARSFAIIPSDSVILKRFRCRLAESIIPYKDRLKSVHMATNLQNTFETMQNCIQRFQDTSIQQFLNKVYAIFAQYLARARRGNNDQKSESPLGKQRDISRLQDILIGPSQIKTFYEEPNNHHKRMKKVISDLNERFKTISGLDLDYSAFRATFFQSKNSYDNLYEECLLRNRVLSEQIIAFSRDFKEYMAKKNKRRMMKQLILGDIQQKYAPEDKNSARKTINYSVNQEYTDFSPVRPNHKNSLAPFSRKTFDPATQLISTPQNKRFSLFDTRKDRSLMVEPPKRTQIEMKKILISPSKFNLDSNKSPIKKIVTKPYIMGDTLKRKQWKEQRMFNKNLPDIYWRGKI